MKSVDGIQYGKANTSNDRSSYTEDHGAATGRSLSGKI